MTIAKELPFLIFQLTYFKLRISDYAPPSHVHPISWLPTMAIPDFQLASDKVNKSRQNTLSRQFCLDILPNQN